MFLDDIHFGFEMHAIFLLLIKWQEGGLKLKKPPGEINETFYRISTQPIMISMQADQMKRGQVLAKPFAFFDKPYFSKYEWQAM